MVIDVSQIINVDGATLEINKEVALDDFNFNGLDIALLSPVEVKGELKNTSGTLYLAAKAYALFKTQCGRCLKDIKKCLEFDIDEVFSNEDIDINSDITQIASNKIDLSTVVLQNFCLNLPMSYLCKEDCMGLCPVCGTDMNENTCSCGDENIDPRLAVLKNFLKEDK